MIKKLINLTDTFLNYITFNTYTNIIIIIYIVVNINNKVIYLC
jgi:hypothetical protein